MARLPYTQGTKAYLASLAILRGENDSKKIAADLGTSLKNVQNVKSIVKRLLKTPLDSNSEKIPVTPVTVPPPVTASSVTVIDSRPAPQPPATPSHREAAPAVQSRPEERSVEEGKASLEKGIPGNGSVEKGIPGNARETREDSQEGDGREFQSASSRETGDSHRESVTTGRELREARKDMRLVKAEEKEFDMQDGTNMGGIMDRVLLNS